MTIMNNKAIIKRVFIHERPCTSVSERYGYHYAKVVYALYDDQTWEEIAVIDGMHNERNSKLRIAAHVTDRTRQEAIEIIEKLIYSCRMDGKLLV